MLGNTFTLVGTAISNYEKIENSKYEKWSLSVEVERKGKNKVDVYKVVVLNWNKTVDRTLEVVGEVVIVNGYLDVFNDNISLIAQDVYIVGQDSKYQSKIENKITPNVTVEPKVDDDDDEEEEDLIEESDDSDLPW